MPADFQQMQVERAEDGQFLKGQSGNPAGREKGSRNRATVLAEQLFDGASGALTNKAVQMALDGDAAALRLVLGRIIAPRRHRPTSFTWPALNTAADCAPAMAAIAAAASEGVLSSAEAAEFSQVVDTFIRAIAAGEIEARLQRLESANGIGA
jgi:hypothetical protein